MGEERTLEERRVAGCREKREEDLDEDEEWNGSRIGGCGYELDENE